MDENELKRLQGMANIQPKDKDWSNAQHHQETIDEKSRRLAGMVNAYPQSDEHTPAPRGTLLSRFKARLKSWLAS